MRLMGVERKLSRYLPSWIPFVTTLPTQADLDLAHSGILQRYWGDQDTPESRWVNLLVAALVFCSSTFFVVETYPIPPEVRLGLERVDRLILGLFVVEYLLRLAAAPQKLRYVFSLYSPNFRAGGPHHSRRLGAGRKARLHISVLGQNLDELQ